MWQTPNQLLRAVFADIQIPEYVARCKALGLINKVITGPLWQVLECNDVSILDMNERAKLDRLLCEKPNATTLCLEGMIVFANNKTSAWLEAKTPEEKEDLLKKAVFLQSLNNSTGCKSKDY